MKRLGHRIYVTSEEGKGTKVFLEFFPECPDHVLIRIS